MHKNKNVSRSGFFGLGQIFFQPVKLPRKQSSERIAGALLRMARVPVVGVQLYEVATGIVKTVDRSLVRRQPWTLRLRAVHGMHKLGGEDDFGALFALFVRLDIVFGDIQKRLM